MILFLFDVLMLIIYIHSLSLFYFYNSDTFLGQHNVFLSNSYALQASHALNAVIKFPTMMDINQCLLVSEWMSVYLS
jgi:hypothetical protein